MIALYKYFCILNAEITEVNDSQISSRGVFITGQRALRHSLYNALYWVYLYIRLLYSART